MDREKKEKKDPFTRIKIQTYIHYHQSYPNSDCFGIPFHPVMSRSWQKTDGGSQSDTKVPQHEDTPDGSIRLPGIDSIVELPGM